jgi:hypothetical protein
MTDDQSFSGKTQVFWACKVLLDGRVINQQTEINEARGWRLGAIIHRLKNEYGWPIKANYLSRGMVQLIAPRPKGMWRRTYQRKRFEIEWCENKANQLFLSK